jgi:aminoglycoside phosphotransferase (APT) family kinase protein
MAPLRFPSTAEALTPGLLTAALSERHPGVAVEDLEIIETAHCDSGSASTAGRVVLGLTYAPGGHGELPERVVLKTMLIRPGAPAAMYENEVRFYRDLRPELEIETPRVYASAFDEESGHFGVVMEDVTLRNARFPDARRSVTVSQITSLLDDLATLHARFWRSPRFRSDLRWLWTPCSGGFYDFLRSGALEFIRLQVQRSEYKRDLLGRRLRRSLDRLWEDLWKVQAILDTEPGTLLHGDCHLGNTYLLPDGRMGLVDWQLMNRGRWSHDITYLLVTALDAELRRGHERELLAHYLEQLRLRGVADVPDPDAAWLLYRQTAIWGLVIGWLICPIENYGDEILQANLDRLATAVEDLETFAVVP